MLKRRFWRHALLLLLLCGRPGLGVAQEKPLPLQLPLRTSAGALFFPESLPDAAEHGAVVMALSNYLDLPETASVEERCAGFAAATDAALAWAHSVAGPIPQVESRTQIADYLKEVQKRVLLVPGLTAFNEFYDNRRPGGGVTSFEYGPAEPNSGAAWAQVRRPDNVLSIVYGPTKPPLLNEATRVHEFAHVADLSRMGLIDGEGKSLVNIDDLDGDARLGLLLELKAHALGLILHRAFHKAAPELKSALYSAGHAFEDLPENPLFFAFFQEMMTYPAYAYFNEFHPMRTPTIPRKPASKRAPAEEKEPRQITLIRTLRGPQDIR